MCLLVVSISTLLLLYNPSPTTTSAVGSDWTSILGLLFYYLISGTSTLVQIFISMINTIFKYTFKHYTSMGRKESPKQLKRMNRTHRRRFKTYSPKYPKQRKRKNKKKQQRKRKSNKIRNMFKKITRIINRFKQKSIKEGEYFQDKNQNTRKQFCNHHRGI